MHWIFRNKISWEEKKERMQTKPIKDVRKGSEQKKIKSDAKIQPGNTFLLEKRSPAYFKFCPTEPSLTSTPTEPPGAFKHHRV